VSVPLIAQGVKECSSRVMNTCEVRPTDLGITASDGVAGVSGLSDAAKLHTEAISLLADASTRPKEPV